uniref:Exportin-T n=1 Tax=Micromonas pusilla TaxID=38833 RepID=A0A7S0IGW8_MICPS|mmetsp:Transcript_6043/g.24965  ORF Transcript_6043/g.24965 Transcript_6043/m.24965 type:complete len:593 (+) Transcript_6043:497-2275(+)
MLLWAWDVLGSKSPAVAAHRLVAPALLEICVRYHLAVERRPALLRPALAAFLDGGGVTHPAREVSRRACYLFCRFVKPTRGQILCHGALPGVMAALEPALMDASVPESANSVGSSAANSVGSSFTGGGTGGATATAGNDDRLYVFEAFGLLLGIDDVPDDLRIRCLEAVFARLRGAVEAASNSHSPHSNRQNLQHAAQHAIVAMGNVAKGFTLRVATQTSPRVGEILASGLTPALRCVQLWPRDPLTRTRVVAYFQRLVTVIGPAVFPHASPLLEHMRSGGGAHASASASDLRECLVLINQLMASFKESLAPFLAAQLPSLVTQIAGALAPFAAPGGGVNGVCGLFLDGAIRVNPRLVPNDEGGSGGANPGWGAVVGAAGNTEEAREARDLEKIFVAHAHGVAANNLAGVLVADPRLRECFLETLAAAASAHPSAMSRKSALQALIRVAQCWLPTAEVVASGGSTRAGEGPVPGFAAFAVSRVAKEACVDAVMRGDLDPKDAGCAAAVAETVNFTRVMLERLGGEFANHLRVNLLGAAWGLDPESHGREYVRRVTSTTQNSAREARAFIAECAKIAQGKNPGVASNKCTPGM